MIDFLLIRRDFLEQVFEVVVILYHLFAIVFGGFLGG